MKISSHTTIAALLKYNPAALDAIVSLNSRFEKLRNPLLRRLMAGRTSIAQAAKIGNVPVTKFLAALGPLGFEPDASVDIEEAGTTKKEKPAPLQQLLPEQTISLDVRPVLAKHQDPLQIIMKQVQQLQPGQVLQLVNSFEPTPLIALLERKGYAAYVEWIHEQEVHTFFYRNGQHGAIETPTVDTSAADWDSLLEKFTGRLKTIDVRMLEMPKPMLTILKELEQLPAGLVLFVYHKRVPVYLIDELKAKQYDYRCKEIQAGEVHMMIWKN